VLVDDLGWADVACFGSKFYETPNIDALAKSGVKMTSAYAACPVCSPTRGSIMTGKYPARTDTTDYFGGRRKGKLLPAPYKHYLPLEEVTIAEAMKAHGYRTFFAGKWHLGDEKYYPTKQGFDVNMGGGRGGAPCKAYGNRALAKDPTLPGGYFSLYANPTLKDGPKGEYLTDRLTDEAIKFIEANKDNPFLCYLSFYSVHNPLQAKAKYVRKFKDKLAKMPRPEGPEFVKEHKSRARQIQQNPVYAAMIYSVDENVGKLMKKLDELGIADDTVVVFTSDNGGLSTSEGHNTANLPLRGGKGWLYEGGLRVPTIIRWPGVTKAGSVCDEPVTSTDYYPTFLEIAGLPAKPKQHCDGVSITAALKGGKLGRKAIYWHYPHYGNQGGRPGSAVRAGDYKLIEFFESGSVELYNLKDDIGEHKDLADKMPGKARELRKMIHDWRKEVDAKMMKTNPRYKQK
jgi:arylsulfatase A-like enzyme